MSTLSSAWDLWLHGKLPDNFELWGLSLFWWGRIGKGLQALAIVTVILELIGPARVLAFGSRLHGGIDLQTVKDIVQDARRYRRSWWAYISSPDKNSDDAKKELDVLRSLRSDRPHALLFLTSLIVIQSILFWRLPFREAYMFGTILFVLHLWASAYVTSAFLIASLSIGWVLNKFAIQPTAFLMTRPRLDQHIKLFALIAGVVGLHFDFLAS